MHQIDNKVKRKKDNLSEQRNQWTTSENLHQDGWSPILGRISGYQISNLRPPAPALTIYHLAVVLILMLVDLFLEKAIEVRRLFTVQNGISMKRLNKKIKTLLLKGKALRMVSNNICAFSGKNCIFPLVFSFWHMFDLTHADYVMYAYAKLPKTLTGYPQVCFYFSLYSLFLM